MLAITASTSYTLPMPTDPHGLHSYDEIIVDHAERTITIPDRRQFQFDTACFLLVYPSKDVESWSELESRTADAIWKALTAWEELQ